MVTINELFSGIGAQVAGLKRLGIAYDVVGISEIDKFAIRSYEAINGSVRNYGDISKVPLLDYADLWTYSFPCQDLSVAGKQAGIKEGTRSGLLLEVERLLENAVLLGNQPKYLLLENVKALVGKKFKPDFDRWLNKLSELGYNNYWKVLNAKDYGIPQNRERVFVVSIRKDLNQTYMFPEPVPLTLKLKDLLEPEVDEKYYLPQEKVEQLAVNGGSLDGKHTWDVVIAASRGRNPSSREAGLPTEQRMEVNSSGVSNTLTTVQKDNLVMYVGNALYPDKNYTGYDYAGATFDAEGLAPTLNTMNGGNRQPYIMQRSHGFNKGGLKENCPTITSQGSWNQNNFIVEQKPYIVSDYGKNLHKETEISHCLQARDYKGFGHQRITGVLEIGNIYDNNNNSQAGRVYDAKGLSPCLDTMGGGNRQPKVLEEGIGHNPISKKFEFDGFHDQPAPTLFATDYKAPKCYSDGIRIRKLTPRECWRLMGFTDVEFDVAQMSGVSNSQLYKQAGNSIVVDVLAAIFKELL